MVCKPKRISMTVMAVIGVIKVGRLRARRTVVRGWWGGVLVTEATDCPVCASILNQGSGRNNRAFTLIWGQVFPLAAVRDPSSGMAVKFHLRTDMRAAILLGLLIGLSLLLRVKAGQNADLAGRSFVLDLAGGILNSGEPPRLGFGGGGCEIQLDGQRVVVPDDQAPRDRGLAGLGLVQDGMAAKGDGFVGSHALENTFLMLRLRLLLPARQFHHHDRCHHDDRAEDHGGRNHLVLGLHV